jgi:regulator of sigma E protease
MEPGEEHPRGFDKKPRWAQALVMISGCVMNFLLGVVIFAIIGSLVGWPLGVSNQIEKVMPSSPAAMVGLQRGDKLLGVNNKKLDLARIREEIQSHPNRPITLVVERAGKRVDITVTPERKSQLEAKVRQEKRGGKVVAVRELVTVQVGHIGVVFRQQVQRFGLVRSVGEGFRQTGAMIVGLLLYLKGLIGGTEPMALMGPVGAVDQLYNELKVGWFGFLLNAAALTIGVGFLNLLPIPPLDGSRLLIVGLESIRRRPFDKRRELLIHLVGMALLLALAVALTYKDIVRIKSGVGY